MGTSEEPKSESGVHFAVISDPHAHAGEAERHQTHTRCETKHDPIRNAFAAVRQLIESSHSDPELVPLRADVLLCPGDLAYKMDIVGLEYSWQEFEQIADLLGAKRIIATAGNHDVVRYEDRPEGAPEDHWVSALKALSPKFPTADPHESDSYFLDDFVLAGGDSWRVIALNSCANYPEENEAWHGKIEEKTLELLKAAIHAGRKDINILMCHHHPVQWLHLARADTSFMDGGERLLRALEEDDPSRWIVLHGHRHVPALGYAGESVSGPVRMSAGSLGRWLRPEGRENVPNQFYILDFNLAETKKLGLTGAGRFRSWNFVSHVGMVQAEQSCELPGHGGFGFRRHSHDLAEMVKARTDELGQRSVTWQELLDGDRRWAYVAPRDLIMLRRTLEMGKNLVEPDVEDPGPAIERISFHG